MKIETLLERANMTADELPEDEDDCEAALEDVRLQVEDIKEQIEDERCGLTDRKGESPDWPYKARHALRMHGQQLNVLKRRYKSLRLERTSRELAENRAERMQNAENNRHAAEAALERQRVKADTHNRRMTGEAEFQIKAVRQLLQTLPEGQREPFYAVMGEAQAEYENMQVAPISEIAADNEEPAHD